MKNKEFSPEKNNNKHGCKAVRFPKFNKVDSQISHACKFNIPKNLFVLTLIILK
jgi:hypothetical protein